MVENFMDGFTIYKKSVFTFKYTINKNNITSEGMFDLERVPNLRIMDNGFLKRLRLKTSKTQRECARLTGIPLRTWIGWESYHKLLPFSKLVVLSKQVGVSKKMLYALIKGAVFSYGKHHGKIKQALPLIPHKFILPKYLIPEKKWESVFSKRCACKHKKYILGAYPFDKCLFKKRGLIVINSYLLAIFLKTFYIYKKESLLNFPLSSETHKLIKSGADLRKSVIIPLLLSDGGEKPDLRLFISGAR